MAQQEFNILVQVVTADGQSTMHEIPVPEDEPTLKETLDRIINTVNSLNDDSPKIVHFPEPHVTYNKAFIVRIHLSVEGPTIEAEAVRERMAGLNIPR